ncbi:ATP-dependent RNA helicase prh1 [Tremella mesenterica]|uniref:RNA helicase n=1 Tax=Tremella mesenterica TaxID=5217 RepID=A0A4V1M4W2_TREME|nr:ATP-dependent RNA helicase prh1 [Tremella mesenterica]
MSKKRKRKLINGSLKHDEEIKRKRRDLAVNLLETRRRLPFYRGREAILKEIIDHDTTIILGETGCGKSTQLPQLLRTHQISLDHYHPIENGEFVSRFKRGPRIAITQPRRLPTIALANRVAAEMGSVVGGEVGYSVRFEEAVTGSTRVRYMTEGVLMRYEEGPNLLLKYDIIIIDEAHERTLNTDFLCGALKRIQRLRKSLSSTHPESNGTITNGNSEILPKNNRGRIRPLKLIIMSATLDPTKFQNFFETGRNALMVKGRVYEVDTRHVLQPVDDFIESAARQVLQVHCTPKCEGDILVFMPGAEEIENCVELLRRVSKELPPGRMKMQILPLYSALPPLAQAKIFAPPNKDVRRVIVATNIAETSMTIPGVTVVIDTGYKKEKEYIFRNSGSIEHLKKKEISKAAAWQRTGRAGRERAGQCYRLFTQEVFSKLPEFDQPEIQRCNLASAVLQLVAMKLDPFTFEYIDNPGREPIAAAFQTLAGLGALSGPKTITPLGLEMLHYPLDPEHSRILLASISLGCTSEIIDILSLLVSGPIWIDRANDREIAAGARTKFVHRDGDHITSLNVFRAYLALKEQRQSGTQSISREKEPNGQTKGNGVEKGKQETTSLPKWCKDNFVNGKTLTAAVKVRDQLRELVRREGHDPDVTCGGETEKVGKALIRGLFMNTAVIQPDGSYRQTAGSLPVKIHPSSVLMSKKVPAIVYDELTITSSIYARNVSCIDQSWLLEIPWFQQAGNVRAPPEKSSL